MLFSALESFQFGYLCTQRDIFSHKISQIRSYIPDFANSSHCLSQARMQGGGGYGGCNPPKFIKSKIFWVNLWQLYYSDSTVFKFCTSNCCHQMSDLRLKCTKFDFGWGSAPDLAGWAYSAPPDPLAGFKGPTSKGREGGREGKGKGWRKGVKGKGREKGGTPLQSTPLLKNPGYGSGVAYVCAMRQSIVLCSTCRMSS